MSKFKLLCFLFLLLPIQQWAQQIDMGNPQKIKSKTYYSQVIGEQGGNVFLLRCKNQLFNSDLTIEKYKSNLALEFSVPLPLPVNGLVERVLLFDEQLLVFIAAKNESTQAIDLLVQRLDFNFKTIQTPRILCSIPESKFLPKRTIQIKPNANKSLFTVMLMSLGQSEQAVLHFYQYDVQLNQKFGKQFLLSDSEPNVFISAFDVSNNGETFALVDYPDAQKTAKERKYFLYGYFPASDKILEFSIQGKDSFVIEDLGICLNNFKQTIAVTGLCAPSFNAGVTGYFFRSYALSNGQLLQSYSAQFEDKFLKQVAATRIERLNADLNDFYIRKVLPRSDGGCILLTEKYYQTRQNYTYYVNNYPQTSSRIIYNFDEIGIINIQADGSLQFAELIKKHQSASTDAGYLLSFLPIVTPDQIYLLLNDEGADKTELTLHSISYEGRFDQHILLKNSNSNCSIIPSEYKQIASNTAIICAIRDKRFTLMRITF